MNFYQALSALIAGKVIRRKCWKDHMYLYMDDGGVLWSDGSYEPLQLLWLGTNDWEVGNYNPSIPKTKKIKLYRPLLAIGERKQNHGYDSCVVYSGHYELGKWSTQKIASYHTPYFKVVSWEEKEMEVPNEEKEVEVSDEK